MSFALSTASGVNRLLAAQRDGDVIVPSRVRKIDLLGGGQLHLFAGVDDDILGDLLVVGMLLHELRAMLAMDLSNIEALSTKFPSDACNIVAEVFIIVFFFVFVSRVF